MVIIPIFTQEVKCYQIYAKYYRRSTHEGFHVTTVQSGQQRNALNKEEVRLSTVQNKTGPFLPRAFSLFSILVLPYELWDFILILIIDSFDRISR